MWGVRGLVGMDSRTPTGRALAGIGASASVSALPFRPHRKQCRSLFAPGQWNDILLTANCEENVMAQISGGKAAKADKK